MFRKLLQVLLLVIKRGDCMVFDTLIRILLEIPRELIKQMPYVSVGQIPLPENFSATLTAMVSTAKNFFPCELLVFICNTMFELRLIRAQRSFKLPFVR